MAAAAPAQADRGGLSAYLAARAADGGGNAQAAATGYARVLQGAPDDAGVAIRAYRAALVVGDMALAERAAASLTRAGAAPSDAALLPLARAAATGDVATTDVAIGRLAFGPLKVLMPSLRAWVAWARGGDPAGALTGATNDPVVRRFAAEDRALVAIAAGRPREGAQGLVDIGPGLAPDTRATGVTLLLGQQDEAGARALAATDRVAAAALAGGGARPTLAFGVAQLLVRVAADLATARPTSLSITLTRAALVADPTNDRARLLLGDALARTGHPDAALATLDGIGRDGAFAALATAARVEALRAAGRTGEALAAARPAGRRPAATVDELQLYADLLVTQGEAGEAVDVYRRLLDRQPGWTAWLQYGGALDEAGRWPAARAALAKAVALAPDQPLALNYLGYAQIEHGEALAASTRLLERAHALAPADASIADSLGWAYYRTGDAARALPLLVAAAARDPTNAEIGEHLGDVYWSLGRRYEARYAWRAAAVTADPPAAARLAVRIADGLPDHGR